jgi:ADP-dependent NAD(P)H-hydrate dehydratase / NAD(P)H-hydrate epimerase
MKIVSVSEMKAIEQAADKRGITYQQMMQNAGLSLARFVVANFNPENKTVLGLIGNGNNGGDTLVALAAIAKSGWQARAYIVKPRPADDPMSEWLSQVGGTIIQANADKDRLKLKEWLSGSSILLDGILGTGVKLPLKQDIGDVLSLAAQARGRLYIIAVDCPSGVDCDSGQSAAQTIPADLTYTMAAVKKGLLRFPAAQFVGRVEVGDIGLPDDFKELKEIKHSVIFKQDVKTTMPRRPRDAHKGTFGTAMIVAGSVNYIGAAQLAGTAAYRSGVGLVRMGVIERVQSALAGSMIESTWLLLPDEEGVITEDAAGVIFENLEKTNALLIGPGIGTNERTFKFIEKLFSMDKGKKKGKQIGFVIEEQKPSEAVQRSLPPAVIDADALNLLARIENWPTKLPKECILTPHPGEMARLTGSSMEEIQKNRWDVAIKFAAKWKQVVVLKGAFTIIAHPDGRTSTIPIATAALARAGTGDILAGLICGLLAQGVEPFQAACSAAWIHAQAGLKASEELGSDAAIMAGDVVNAIPRIVRGLSK